MIHLLPLLLSTAIAATPPRLEEIQIEGRLQLPEVLFISAHEPPHFDDGLHHLYLVHLRGSSLDLAPDQLGIAREVRSNLVSTITERLVTHGGPTP